MMKINQSNNRRRGVPVSGLACKELESHHSMLTGKMLNKWKHQQHFLDLRRIDVTGQTAAPKLERQVNTENHNLPEHKPTTGNSAELRKPEL